jgi:O-antigen/teichoic acid export membrane protein
VSLPLALAALLCLPFVSPLIQLVAGPEFRGAVGPTIALVVGAALSFATLHVRPLFLVRHQLRAMLAFTTVVAVISVATFIPAAAWFGATGVAWARTVTVVLGVMAMLYYLRRTRRTQMTQPAVAEGNDGRETNVKERQ